MQKSVKIFAAAVLLVGFALTGCGSATSGTTATPVKTIPFRSAAVAHGALPERYTCDGRNISPPLEWGNVPSSTKELALLVIGLVPSATSGSYNVSIEWAVAGLNPNLHHLAAGRLPPGAYLGGTSSGKARYSVCPAPGKGQVYNFALYAVPTAVKIPQRFEGIQVLGQIGSEGASAPASAIGSFQTIYKRR
jgi:phosphatidylethanolamine-binding protein (PEBP) family uncharacterized protein